MACPPPGTHPADLYERCPPQAGLPRACAAGDGEAGTARSQPQENKLAESQFLCAALAPSLVGGGRGEGQKSPKREHKRQLTIDFS